MLYSVKNLIGYAIAARDGVAGELRDMLFDDRLWVVRRWVLDSDAPNGRRRWLSPHALSAVDPKRRELQVALSREQLESRSRVERARPPTQQEDAEAGDPYGWRAGSLWNIAALPLDGLVAPIAGAPPAGPSRPSDGSDDADDRHLRSCAEFAGCTVSARDGSIGHVADFLVHPATWDLGLLVVEVDTPDAPPDGLVLVPPAWIDGFDASARGLSLRFGLSRGAVLAGPRHVPVPALPHDEALRVQRHFEGGI